MAEPNVQTIPRDYIVELEKEKNVEVRVRDIFVPKTNQILVSADYCQIELRLLAHLSGDEQLRKRILGSPDIFISIASSIFCVQENEVIMVVILF